MIWHEHQISRAEIARRTGLSRSTVSEIVSGLLDTRLVAEVGDGPSRGGRRPILLAFQDDAFVILGVDMGATHVSVALTNLRGQVLAWQHRDHAVRGDPSGTGRVILELCDACLTSWGGARRRLLGVGVAVPSPVESRHPDRLSDVVLPAWSGQSAVEGVRSRYGVPVFVDNDANLGALAERWWGAGRGVDDFTYIKVATGVGSGHMIRGEIYRGATGVAGEIGHLAIDPNGEPCICGNRGCLGTLVGTQALVARATALLPEFPDSALHGVAVTITALEDAALADDPLALRVVQEAAQHLGIAVAGVLNLMNPARVILGGGLSRLSERLLAPLRETVLRRTLVNSVAASDIQTSELGPRDIALGAATHVLDAALTDPRLFPGAKAG
jgi:predicted NBD/HSP70 family sugar kinase